MNEFTKTELRDLDGGLEQFRFSCVNPEWEKRIEELRKKLWKMIDNYCEGHLMVRGECMHCGKSNE